MKITQGKSFARAGFNLERIPIIGDFFFKLPYFSAKQAKRVVSNVIKESVKGLLILLMQSTAPPRRQT
ncbi:hypothetical protein [Acinetobacter terrestris]|uniref:hypothetical protein n=1 Tax=Acinetobacter terrestris TaxID=2529843 RepID=UPI0013F1590D|nr:hypothetical protein [Acinetobacter terrestris]